MRIATALAAGTTLLALGAAGCGSSSSGAGGATTSVDPNRAEVSPAGDIPDNQAFVAYAPPGAGFSVKVPEGWARTTAAGTAVFSDKLNSIRMEARTARAGLTVREVKQVEVPRLARAATGFRLRSVTTVHRAAGPAIRIAYLADSKADPVTGKVGTNAIERYIFFRGGREAVLTLTGPQAADNVDPWKLVSNSLRWTR